MTIKIKQREYMIYVDRPPWPYNKTLGNIRYSAFPYDHKKGWNFAVDLLPATVVSYTTVTARNKKEAVEHARKKWPVSLFGKGGK